jgi:hypothetical protein
MISQTNGPTCAPINASPVALRSRTSEQGYGELIRGIIGVLRADWSCRLRHQRQVVRKRILSAVVGAHIGQDTNPVVGFK